MADVIVKVRAKREQGFIRAGVRWGSSDTFQRVTEEQAKQLEAEPMLRVERVSEGSVPSDQQAAVSASAGDSDKNADQKRAEFVDQEFPQLAAPPGGVQQRVGAADNTEALAQGYRTAPAPGDDVKPLEQEPIKAGGGSKDDFPEPFQGTKPPENEPQNQVVDLAASAFSKDPLLEQAAEQTTKKKHGK